MEEDDFLKAIGGSNKHKKYDAPAIEIGGDTEATAAGKPAPA